MKGQSCRWTRGAGAALRAALPYWPCSPDGCTPPACVRFVDRLHLLAGLSRRT